MRRIIAFCLLPAVIVVCINSRAYAGGLSTTFTELLVEGLEAGKEYSLQEAVEFPLVVHNTSEEQVELKVEALYPKDEELKKGYEPIPDIAWIAFQQEHFILGPGKKAKTDVIVRVPEDTQYKGKRYQVYIWSHTIGRALGVGLKSRLLFTVE